MERGAVGSGDVSVIGRLVVVPSRRGPGLGRWSVSATMSPCSSSTTSIPRPAEPCSPLSAPSRGFPTVSRAPGVCSFHRDRRRRARLAAGALVHTYARTRRLGSSPTYAERLRVGPRTLTGAGWAPAKAPHPQKFGSPKSCIYY